MSRFYANIKGNRGEATRAGSEKSGMHGHIRGWNIGGRVECFVNSDGQDEVRMILTAGTNGVFETRWLGSWVRDDDGNLIQKD
jgi:hypothetical protein